MARIRTIKPEFWQDEKLTTLTDCARLIFLGLISHADDFGRLLDNPKLIEAQIFDGFSDRSRDVRESLDTLSRIGRIRRGKTSAGQRVIEIVNWSRHQKVDKPNKLSALGEVVEPVDVADRRATVADHSRDCRESVAKDSRLIPTTNDHLPGIDDRGSSTDDQPPPPPGGGGVPPIPPPPNSGGSPATPELPTANSRLARTVPNAHDSPVLVEPTVAQQGITDPVMLARRAEFAKQLDAAVAHVPHDGARAAMRRLLDELRTPQDRWQRLVSRMMGWQQGLSTTGMRPVSWEAIDEGIHELLDGDTGEKITPQIVLIFVEKAERRRQSGGVPTASADAPRVLPAGMSPAEVGEAIRYARRGAQEWIDLCREKGIDFAVPTTSEATS